MCYVATLSLMCVFSEPEGLKLEVLTSLLPSVGQKTAKVNAIYKQPNVHTVASLDVFKVCKLLAGFSDEHVHALKTTLSNPHFS
jgi:hypothetical protein